MLRYVEPNLKDIACGHAVLSNGASKYAFVVSRNPNKNVLLFFSPVSRNTKVSHNVRTQALKIKIRFNAVNKADPQCFCGFKQGKADTRALRRVCLWSFSVTAVY
jgi:hypothetical protein